MSWVAKGLLKQLQGSETETVKAYEMVSLVTEELNNILSNQVKKLETIFKKGRGGGSSKQCKITCCKNSAISSNAI